MKKSSIMEAKNTTFDRPSHDEVRQMFLRAKARQQQLEEEGKTTFSPLTMYGKSLTVSISKRTMTWSTLWTSRWKTNQNSRHTGLILSTWAVLPHLTIRKFGRPFFALLKHSFARIPTFCTMASTNHLRTYSESERKLFEIVDKKGCCIHQWLQVFVNDFWNDININIEVAISNSVP